MFRFSSFASRSKLIKRAFSSTYETHINQEQLIHIRQNLLDILLWVRLIGLIEFTDFTIRHIDFFK
jgi:hypothetical protein